MYLQMYNQLNFKFGNTKITYVNAKVLDCDVNVMSY